MSNTNNGNILQNELLTVTEVAAYFRVSRVTIWRWCQEGLIPAFQIGRSWRISRDELLELENHLKNGREQLKVQESPS
jgi:excisionase family DNA binding protein